MPGPGGGINGGGFGGGAFGTTTPDLSGNNFSNILNNCLSVFDSIYDTFLDAFSYLTMTANDAITYILNITGLQDISPTICNFIEGLVSNAPWANYSLLALMVGAGLGYYIMYQFVKWIIDIVA